MPLEIMRDKFMRCLKRYFVLAAVLLLGACAGPLRDSPAPVDSRDGQVQDTYSGSGAQVRAYQPPQQVALAKPQPARAVQVLMRRAEDQRRAGDYVAAAASLERGLRIEPRNASLWNKLAHVRLAQQQYDRVEQFAAKSNALVGDDRSLLADNWYLIAQSRAARGDHSGAAKARNQARVYR